MNMDLKNKKLIRLTESDLHRIIREVIDTYIGNDKNEFKELIEYLSQKPTENFRDENGRIKTTELKAYNYIEPLGVVNNVYALHFTNMEAYDDILENGFKGGTCDFDRLAYSGAINNRDDSCTDGFFFALPIDGEYIGENCGYGDCGFILKLNSALLTFHHGDGDKEIIFKRGNVMDMIGFMFDGDYDCWAITRYDFEIDKNELTKYGGYIHSKTKYASFDNLRDLIRFVSNYF